MPLLPSEKNLFFNDNDPYAAAWLRNLFPYSVVCAADIQQVTAAQVAGPRRVHLFAGLGGWQQALQLAGWPTSVKVWTCSCPCQPFSGAGSKKGESDARHLWPEARRLIKECRPPICFGEQVSGKLGVPWLARVRSDLEQLGYAVGGVDLPAASVGAPHSRQRLFWVADTNRHECHDAIADAAGKTPLRSDDEECSNGGRTAEPSRKGLRPPWDHYEWLGCFDGKKRRIPGLEQGVFPLAPRLPGTVEQIRAYGNAIVPQVAAEFVRAFMETKRD